MQQQGLDLIPRIPYEANMFVQHKGVTEVIDLCLSSFKTNNFASRFIIGSKRSGKTHLSIWLGSQASNSSFIPTYIDGNIFNDWVKNIGINKNWTNYDVVIVDDIDFYLKNVFPGHSGAFVDFYERLKFSGSKLFLLSTFRVQQLPCDQHITSRLNSAYPSEINHPEFDDLDKIIRAVTWQRGIKLKEKQIKFLVKRVSLDIRSIEAYVSRMLHLAKVLGSKVNFDLIKDAV